MIEEERWDEFLEFINLIGGDDAEGDWIQVFPKTEF